MAVTMFGFDETKAKLMQQNNITPDHVMLRYLSEIGERMCSHARMNKGGHPTEYIDRTHALRSSICYRIYKNGETVKDGGFQSVGNDDGVQDGKKALEAYGLAYSIPTEGWTLVIVAGENYARYVEAKGYNVLHLTSVKVREEVEKLEAKLGLR